MGGKYVEALEEIDRECQHCGSHAELIDGLCPQCYAEYMNWIYGD